MRTMFLKSDALKIGKTSDLPGPAQFATHQDGSNISASADQNPRLSHAGNSIGHVLLLVARPEVRVSMCAIVISVNVIFSFHKSFR